jgi:hypothetical protein
MREERGKDRENAGAADEEVYAGLDDPAFGFGGFEFEAGEGFEWITGEADFGIVGFEFLGEVDGACEDAVGFVVEAKGDRIDGVDEDVVVLEVEGVYGETSFDGGELSEHGSVDGWGVDG